MFQLPYTLSRYKKGINPVTALYEELQKAQFTTNKNKFDKWIIQFCTEHADNIIHAIKNDIIAINNYVQKYKKAENLPFLEKLVNKLRSYIVVFECLK